MNLKELIDSYILYNHWANKRLIEWLKTLNPEILYQQTDSSFASIDLTLQHMKNAQNFWYTVILKEDTREVDETIITKSIDTVIDDLLNGSQRMIDTYTAFSNQDMECKATSPFMTAGRYDFILHVKIHNSYHRGQIVTIARLLGATSDIPCTDYEAYLFIEQTNAKS